MILSDGHNRTRYRKRCFEAMDNSNGRELPVEVYWRTHALLAEFDCHVTIDDGE